MGKLPAFQFYPADWRKDPGVQALTYEERGIWFELLCIMHESDSRGFLKINDQKIDELILARMLGLTVKKVQKVLKTLDFFKVYSVDENGVIYCRRMVKDEHILQVRRAAGKLGGSPLLKQVVKQTIKQKPTPSSSSSFPSSSSTTVKIPPNPQGEDMATAKGLIEMFIVHCYDLPKPTGEPGKARKRALLARFKELNSCSAQWGEFCRTVQKSDFLCGRTDNPFSCGIDWVLKPANFTKINEGNYDNKGGKKTEKPQPLPEKYHAALSKVSRDRGGFLDQAAILSYHQDQSLIPPKLRNDMEEEFFNQQKPYA